MPALPFLKPRRRDAAVIISTRKAEGGQIEQGEEGSLPEGLHMASEDLIRAVHSKDAAAVSEALKAAFEILDAQPHEEGPHTNDEEGESK